MGPGSVFFGLFFAAISCAWGYDDAQEQNPWIPKLLLEEDNMNFPVVNSFQPIRDSVRNPGTIEEFRLNIERIGEKCGDVELLDGVPVTIDSENLMYTSKTCTWNFNAAVPGSTIDVVCDPFLVKKCKNTFLKVDGTKYCVTNPLDTLSFVLDSLTIIYKIKTKPTDLVFSCTITATNKGTTTSTTTSSTTTSSTTTSSTTTTPTTTSTTTTPTTTSTTTTPTTTTTSSTTTTPTTTTSTTTTPTTTTSTTTSTTTTPTTTSTTTTPTTTTTSSTTTSSTTTTPTTTTSTTTSTTTTPTTTSTTTTPTTTTSSTTTTPTTTSTTTTPTTTTTSSTTTTPTTTTKPPKNCGKPYKLKPGKSVTIKSKKFPKKFPPNQKCIWNFKGTSKMTTISIVCKPFDLLKCKDTSLTVTGKNLDKMFCGKKKVIKASSSNNQMEVVFESKKKTSKGFKCKVTASKKLPCEPCGTVNRAKRIVGGVETEVNEYPWQVAIVYTGTNTVFCSGAVYNDLFVMTAAHCGVSIGLTGNMADVLLGAHDLNNLGSAQRIAVSEVISDGLYNAPITFDHDIALLKLVSRATLSDNVKPACLPNPSNDYAGVNAIVTGWGQTAEVGFTSSVLMEVEVPVISNAACKAVYLDYITDNILCTQSPNGGKDKCYYDDGAPLVVKEDGKWVVIGVGSWSVGCGQLLFPGGYERVSRYLDFLANNAAEGNDLCQMTS